jgi:GMP synthase (glutamine-hydrolysing)
MKVVAFLHAPLENIGLIAASLERHHVACQYLDLYKYPETARDAGAADGLILMGGPMSANDDLAWLRTEMQCLRDALDRGIPVLGVCLGAQLIAKALGARVYPNSRKEIGWFPVYWTAAASADPLLEGLSHPETVFHWHGETFEMPRNAELLAYSDACAHQAFRAAGNVYGLQFHLEVTSQMIEDWYNQDAACGSLREAETRMDPCLNAARTSELAATVFDRWCVLLRYGRGALDRQ